jgi:hypothetical protein
LAKKKPTVIALIDADYLEYAAGFAGQHTYHLLTSGDDAIIGSFEDAPSRKAAEEAWVAKGGDPASLQRWERTEVEPVENVLHSTKKMLQSIVERVGEKFKANVEPRVYLTGSGNFRERIATIRPYKGNRKPWHKPRLQREIREYMVKNWGGKVIHDQEADDEVCIQQTQLINDDGQVSVICGIDKDLLQCPGWHYDANKDAFANITAAQGTVQFYKQLLTGDTTDNVGGCYKMGAKAASDLIAEAKAKFDAGKDYELLSPFLYSQVLQAYARSVERYGPDTGYEKLGAAGAVLENGRLLWLRRFYGETWNPPK